MRALVQTSYGGAEALELRTVPYPIAAAGEVLVRVHATLVNDADLQPGQRLLVNGAGGGVGPLIAQLAIHHGVRDIVGVDDAVKQEFMREVGFARTLDCRAVDFTRTGERFDVIIDTRMTRSLFSLARARPRRNLRGRRRHHVKPLGLTLGGLPIGRVVPLPDTGLAMKRFGAAEHRGKIVIGVAE